MKITKNQIKKAIKLINCGLSSGLGSPEPGKMCIEAVWCKVLGLPHGDDPKCVTHYLRRLNIRLNDANWSSNEARAKGMLKLGVAQVGSFGVLDEEEFRSRVATMTRRVMIPIALRATASVQNKKEHAEALEKAASELESDPSVKNCKKAKAVSAAANATYAYAAAANATYAYADAADAAAYAANAATYAYADAAYAAAYAANAATYAYADAADAAAYASAYASAYAYAAAYAAAYADYAANATYATYAAVKAAKRDEVLTRVADEVLAILIDMKAPGCKWLPLCE